MEPRQDTVERIGDRRVGRDEHSLADAYAALRPALLAYASRIVGPTDAEDVVQRTFLDAWRREDLAEPGDPRFTAWLYATARSRAIDTLRARTRAVTTIELRDDEPGDDGRADADRYADADALRTALAALPEHERAAVELRHLHELTQQEIATRLGVPLGTVKARIARGTRRLGTLVRQRQPSRHEYTTEKEESP